MAAKKTVKKPAKDNIYLCWDDGLWVTEYELSDAKNYRFHYKLSVPRISDTKDSTFLGTVTIT